jgi:hypothetical protein
MSYPIFPFSPLPAEMQRVFDWNENETRYDSGAYQTDTNYVKPLYQWDLNVKLMLDTKAGSLRSFAVNSVKGRTLPFLMKDAYDYQITSVLGVRSGITNAATLFLCDANSYMVRADTTTIASLFSALSGYVRLGVQYSYEQDTGIITVNTKATTDVWGVRSAEYFRKVKFASQPYTESSALWNIFATDMKITELP